MRTPLTLALSLACLCGTLATPPLAAQPTAAAALSLVEAGRADADTAALLQALGGRDGLVRLTAAFIDRARDDPRTGPFFRPIKASHLKQQLADHFCQLLHGPCVYDGESMKNAHAGLAITRKDFLAVVDVLQDTMDAQGLPFAVQNRLLARLAPLHRDIVSPP